MAASKYIETINHDITQMRDCQHCVQRPELILNLAAYQTSAKGMKRCWGLSVHTFLEQLAFDPWPISPSCCWQGILTVMLSSTPTPWMDAVAKVGGLCAAPHRKLLA